MDKIRQWMYYFIIGIVSLIALCFLPMIGSDIGLGWNLPNTSVGWIVWIVTKLIVAVLNVLIFHCFMLQAKINIKENEKYKEAKELLSSNKVKDYIPRSPNLWNKLQYGQKGVTIFITTALSTVALTQAMLTFDYMSMLTYLFTIIMGLIFGVMLMKTAEDYWTEEFYEYAQRKIKENSTRVEVEDTKYKDTSDISSDSRADILESSNSDSTTSSNNIEYGMVGYSWDDLRFLGRSVHSRYSTSDISSNSNKQDIN